MDKHKQEKWIIEYLKNNCGTSVTDQKFHEDFYNEFGGKRKETLYGAMPVYKAMKLLKEMYDMGILTRGIVTLDINWRTGFPFWNYVYFLKV